MDIRKVRAMPNEHTSAVNPICEFAAKCAQCKGTRKAEEEADD